MRRGQAARYVRGCHASVQARRSGGSVNAPCRLRAGTVTGPAPFTSGRTISRCVK